MSLTFNDEHFVHITEASLYITYLSGKTTFRKFAGLAKNISLEKSRKLKYKSKIGLAGKPFVIYPSSIIVKGRIDLFVSVSDKFYAKNYSDKYDTFYNMMQGFNFDDTKRGIGNLAFNQIERSINLDLVFEKEDTTFIITIIGVHHEKFDRNMKEGFMCETMDFLAFDMIDETRWNTENFSEIH